METLTIEKYVCGICGCAYNFKESALRCEQKPVTHDDVSIGDTVRITNGAYAGQTLKVESKWIVDLEGPTRYHHTVNVNGKVIGSFYSRTLTFDQREPIV